MTDWRKEWFEIEDATYLNAAGQGPLPRVALHAAGQALEWKKFPHTIPDSVYFDLPNRVRTSLAKLIGGAAEEIAITTGTSSGLAAVAAGLDWRPGDEVLIARGEFPAHFTTWLPMQASAQLKVIGSQEAPTRLDYDHFQLCRGLHGQPGCEMRGKFTTRDQDFIAGPPVETGSHCCETRGCAGGNGDLFGCAPYQLCERGSNAVRQVKINAVRYGVREFLPFERLPRRMKRNAG